MKGIPMNPSIWKATYSVGNKELDSDHQMLFDLLHDCYLDFSALDNKQVNPDIISKLKNYATRHFSYEEARMLSGGYPDFAHHEQQHRYFEKKVAELGNISKEDGMLQFESMLFFMKDWFTKHILEEDKKYTSYI
jgi:hemerythrin